MLRHRRTHLPSNLGCSERNAGLCALTGAECYIPFLEALEASR